MQYLSESGAQVFLSTTEPSLVKQAALDDTAWYSVKAGVITRQN
jgi:DNA replication and repair protein RecF